MKFLQKSTMALETVYQMLPLSNTGQADVFVKCLGLRFSLPFQGLRKAFLVDGLQVHERII